MEDLYRTFAWRRLRAAAIARDDGRCVVALFLGGRCSGPLNVHHVEPAKECPDLALELSNLATCCGRHHRSWEALRRALVRSRQRDHRRCPHRHPTAAGREACERRLSLVA